MLRKTPLLITLSAGLAFAQVPPQTSPDASPTEHARVFVTDSQSWEVRGGAGGTSGGFGAENHGGARL